MKTAWKIVTGIVVVIGLAFLSGCGKNKGNIQVTAQYTLCEYDVESQKEGKIVTGKTIECGKDYKLSLDFEFEDLKSAIGNKKIDVTMQVQLGIFDNDTNVQLYASENVSEDIVFAHKEEGLWEAKFKLSRKKIPDFSESYFIISVDSLEEENTNLGNVIAVTFMSEKNQIKIDGLNEYQIPLEVEKGTFSFTKDGNVGEGNIIIKVPENCKEVTLMIYTDESKTELCGIERFGEESFYGNILAVILSDHIVEYIGEKKYNELSSAENFSVHLQIIAEGGESYQNAVVDMEYVFD
ncbi:MAG: hypothetical protein J6K04_05250 [Lachnospiraceae bacterium]|nr:hypothetical protein [Lachnospiraceae bacterium]